VFLFITNLDKEYMNTFLLIVVNNNNNNKCFYSCVQLMVSELVFMQDKQFPSH